MCSRIFPSNFSQSAYNSSNKHSLEFNALICVLDKLKSNCKQSIISCFEVNSYALSIAKSTPFSLISVLNSFISCSNFFNIYFNVPKSLHCICMKYYIIFFCKSSYFVYRLQGSRFIIGSHNRNHHGISFYCLFNCRYINSTIRHRLNNCFIIIIIKRHKNSLMFYRRGNDMASFCLSMVACPVV